jgi:hypothetical protein
MPVILISLHSDLKRIATESFADTYIEKAFDIANFEKSVEKFIL